MSVLAAVFDDKTLAYALAEFDLSVLLEFQGRILLDAVPIQLFNMQIMIAEARRVRQA